MRACCRGKRARRYARPSARAAGGTRVRMPFVKEEGGFTSPAAAVALLVVLSLLFVSVHGYSVGTRSGQVQYVADAGALAADKVVAEYVTAGQVVDAVLLTSSLAALGVYAASAVAAFIPGGASTASSLAEVGAKVVQFRKKFANAAESGLNAAQELLPALIAARAAACVQANAQASGLDYAGAAVPFPTEGVEVSLSGSSALEEAAEDITECEATVEAEVATQTQAQEDLDAAKEAAWLADCGNSGMSMRERAAKLAGLSGSSNPDYSSASTWSFSVALARAKAYYAARYAAEAGASYESDDPEEVADSVARKRYYKYALAQVSEGSVGTTSTGLEQPDLKTLAHNTTQIRETELYTESIYPVSSDEDGTLTLHGYTGCPVYEEQQAAGTAAVSAIDAGTVQACSACKFRASSLGKVAQASASISNGFEYYYLQVVAAAEDYNAAAEQLEESSVQLQAQSDSIAQLIEEAASSIAAERYDPQPPGRYGCVCIVYAQGTGSTTLPFVGTVGGLASRVAISGATLAADPADEQGDVISDIADGLLPETSGSSTLLHAVLGAWGSLLVAYTNGTEGLEDAFDTLLGAIPLAGTTLSESAADAFQAALEASGLEPADLSCYKPVLVNSSHVLQADGGTVATALLRAKNAADAYGAASAGDLSVLRSQLESYAGLGDELEDGLELAELPFGELGLSTTSLSLSVPADVSELLADAASALGSLEASGS